MGARRAVPAAKASGRYRFGEGTFPTISGNDGEATILDLPGLAAERAARNERTCMNPRGICLSGFVRYFLLISRWRTNWLRWRVLLMEQPGDGKQSPAHRPEGGLTVDEDTIRWHGVV